MNTLKLTTLAMLIPLGWAVSVEAYPRFLEEPGDTLELAPQSTCHAEAPGRPVPEASKDSRSDLRVGQESLLSAHDTSMLHADRNAKANVCRLDLNYIDIN